MLRLKKKKKYNFSNNPLHKTEAYPGISPELIDRTIFFFIIVQCRRRPAIFFFFSKATECYGCRLSELLGLGFERFIHICCIHLKATRGWIVLKSRKL